MDLADSDIERILLAMPFEKFERRKFFKRRKELTQIQCDRTLWRSLSDTDKTTLKAIAQTALTHYYDRLSTNREPHPPNRNHP